MIQKTDAVCTPYGALALDRCSEVNDRGPLDHAHFVSRSLSSFSILNPQGFLNGTTGVRRLSVLGDRYYFGWSLVVGAV